jgi:hypothetical protein
VSLDDTRRGCERLHRLDPDHPILVNHSCGPTQITREQAGQWGEICDITGFDFYPVPLSRLSTWGECILVGWNHSIGVMGDLTEKFGRWVPGKPVLPVLQAFCEEPLEYGKAGYPTPQQSRFMAYHVVIRGAKGISYYGQARVSRPSTAVSIPPRIDKDTGKAAADFARARELNDWFWGEFRPVVRELGAMAPVFAAREAVRTPRGDAPAGVAYREGEPPERGGVEVSLRQLGDVKVLLLVNNHGAPARIRVVVPGFAKQTVYCWHENRKVTADAAGRFVDDVEAWGVRVYSTAPLEAVLGGGQ